MEIEPLKIKTTFDDLRVSVNFENKVLVEITSDVTTGDEDEDYECESGSIALQFDQAVLLRDKLNEYINSKHV